MTVLPKVHLLSYRYHGSHSQAQISDGIDKGRVACILHWYVLLAGPIGSFQSLVLFIIHLDSIQRWGGLASQLWLLAPQSPTMAHYSRLPACGDDDNSLVVGKCADYSNWHGKLSRSGFARRVVLRAMALRDPVFFLYSCMSYSTTDLSIFSNSL